MSRDERNPMTGIRGCSMEKIPCRDCQKAIYGHYCADTCEAYPAETGGKPDEVYFDNAPCPKYEKGNDLLDAEAKL